MSEYVSAQYLAERTGFTDRYFRDLAASGKLPGAYQPSGHGGGSWRFNLKQFNRWHEGKRGKNRKSLHACGAHKRAQFLFCVCSHFSLDCCDGLFDLDDYRATV
jgi:hypothetical protein